MTPAFDGLQNRLRSRRSCDWLTNVERPVRSRAGGATTTLGCADEVHRKVARRRSVARPQEQPLLHAPRLRLPRRVLRDEIDVVEVLDERAPRGAEVVEE